MARVRVDMPINPNGHVEFQDGSKYPVHNGYAELPAQKAWAARQSGLASRANFNAVGGGQGVVCSCGFHAWAWSTTCPRCGGPLS